MADLGSAFPFAGQAHDGAEARSVEAMLAEATDLDLVHSELRHRFRNAVALTQ